ncbi:hypothetical protein ACFQ08_08090 [Streptosporangium algeriense]|uniref:Uncharacterized protein n=1 Tax=Streptosporangium algeriense TaxID=1682748 RepID=A0ABW3DPE1_9ACTN
MAVAAGSGAAVPASTPIGPRELTLREAALLNDAEQLLIKQCMRQGGFAYWVVEAAPPPDFPYVLADVNVAQAHGYGTVVSRRNSPHPNQVHGMSLSLDRRQAWLAAIHGRLTDGQFEATLPSGGVVRHSTRGCTSQAQQQLYGDARTWFRVKEIKANLRAVKQDAVGGDPAFVTAMAGWADCMRGRGQVFRSPGEIRAVLDRSRQEGTEDRWRRAAVAEATCARRTGLSATAHSLDRHYEQRLHAEYREELTTWRRLALSALPRARTITAFP